ncbi:hypothetical protein E4T56_gene10363, partial [Termitomyces sp. T112]
YWGGALAGRLAGTWLLHRWTPTRMLGLMAGAAAVASAMAAGGSGHLAGYAGLATGLCNAIMFPVIYSITVERSPAPSAAVSGLLSTAIAGGAILSVLVGWTGEHWGFGLCFVIPMVAYVLIGLFAACAARSPAFGTPPQAFHHARQFRHQQITRQDRVLPDRGQGRLGHTGRLAVVIADDGHIAGHAQPAFLQRAHGPDRHQIRGSDDRIATRLPTAQGLHRHPPRQNARGRRALHDQIGREARPRQRAAKARDPFGQLGLARLGRGDRRGLADEGDPLP